MKTKLLLYAFALLPMFAAAQEVKTELPTDTTVYINGRKYVIRENDKKLNIKVFGQTQRGDTIADDMVYEATYNDEQTTERRFEFSVPFMKKKPKHYYNDGVDWFNEISLGLSGLNDNFGIGDLSDVGLKYSRSYEINLNLFTGHFHLSNNDHWRFTPGLRWFYSTYRLNGDYAFIDNNGTTSIQPGTVGTEYAVSRLRYNGLRMPIAMEWRNFEHSHAQFKVAAGIEPEWRYRIRSRAKVNGEKEILGRGMNVYPLGLNVFMKATFEDVGFYVRCSTTKMFRNNQGPEMYPWSWGIVWNL